MSNTIHIDSTKTPINAVSVFQVNRAEVQRLFSVDFKAGQNEVHLKGLPNLIDEDSIRVEGLGNAVIFDVIYKPPPPPLAPNAQDESHAALRSARTQLARLEFEKEIFQDKDRILNDYAKTLNAGETDKEDLGKFLDLYGTEKGDIHVKLKGVEESIRDAEKQIKDEEEKLSVDEVGKKRMVQVTVIVLADVDGKAELSLSYVLSGASWTPFYDLRATVSPGGVSTTKGSSKSSSVSLQYRASISQSTGEDWSSVDLTLSTASPLTSSTIPTLDPWRIKPSTSTSSWMRSRAMKMMFTSSTPQRNATFVIDGKSNIPSDDGTGSDEKTHKVVIAVIDMAAKLDWAVVPKEQASAFLRCLVKNTSSYVLLDGEASVFMDNNFICKTRVPDVSPQESFSTSLGVDPSLRVTYHPLVKKTKAFSGNLGNLLALQNKIDVTSHTQRLTIKNTRSSLVSPLIIKDQVPVSTDSAVKVLVHVPKELGDPKERKEVTVAPGIKARWSIKGRDEDEDSASASGSASGGGLSGVEDEGVVEWLCDIEAGKSIDLTLAWDILVPAGKNWVYQ